MSLRKTTLSGFLWTISQQFSVQIVNFVVQIVLARLLLPKDFGTIAVIQIFLTVCQSLIDGGMTSSLIRSKDVDNRDYSTVFYMNLLVSILLYFSLYLLSPLIAEIFNNIHIVDILRVLALLFIFQSFSTVQITKLTKEMKFKQQMFLQLPALVLSAFVGIFLAYNGYGAWSLVYMQLSNAFFLSLFYFFKIRWIPALVFDKEKFKLHFGFGYKLTLSSLITNVYTNSYSFLIGAKFNMTSLGYYNQADTLRMFPVRNLTSALQKVTYSMFANISDEKSQLNVFKKITQIVFFVVNPIMFSMILIAYPLFEIFLTPKWFPSVPYFQVLCLTAVCYPISLYNLNIILVKGRSDLHLKMEFIKKGLSIPFLLLIFPYGIWGMIIAQSISMIIHMLVNAFYAGTMLNYPLGKQLYDIAKIWLLSFICLVIFYFIDMFFFQEINPYIKIILNLSLYFGTYILLCIFFKIKILNDVRILFMNLIKKKL